MLSTDSVVGVESAVLLFYYYWNKREGRIEGLYTALTPFCKRRISLEYMEVSVALTALITPLTLGESAYRPPFVQALVVAENNSTTSSRTIACNSTTISLGVLIVVIAAPTVTESAFG